MRSESSGKTEAPVATVLFAQVCEGPGLERQLGPAAAETVFERLALGVEAQAKTFGGRIVKRVGHEMLCSFPDPASAAGASIAFQQMCQGAEAAELSLRIGFHHGDVHLAGDRVAGPAVYRAKRITDVAKASQILVEEELLEHLKGEGFETRLLDRLNLRGQDESVVLHEVIWNALDATVVLAARPGRVSKPVRLRLEVAGQEIVIEAGESLTLGRAASCDCRIEATGVSRSHATIRGERNRFYLVDSSTNGSWLASSEDAEATFVRRDELRLGESGLIGLGERPSAGAAQMIRFWFEK